ncbi:MAG: ATP-grasp domain-containing protein [Muribaculaceae bacterium]|nr:ATP-grasp domain-containing protein [Muribaculaceae bacterium]
MTDRLLILGAGEMQVPVIVKANEMGFETVVVDFDSNAPGVKFASKFYEVSTLDSDRVLEIAEKEKVNGLLTTSDAPVRVVAYVGSRLNLPAMSEKVSEICTDKYLQRELFSHNGINCPAFSLCDRSTDLSKFTEFPYIVKPVDSSASRGVSKVSNSHELEEAAKEALGFSRSGKFIVESFIEGREFSVETLTQNNETHIITITEKLTKGEDEGFFVEDTHIEPARITDHEKDRIEEEVRKAILAIGIDNCPTHTEVKLNPEGAFIIEIACRLGGDYITSSLVPLSTGVDMLENLIRLSVGRPIDCTHKFEACSAVQFLNPENYGRCVEYVSSSPSHIQDYRIEPFMNRKVRNSLDRLGYIVLQTESMSFLENELHKIK